MLTSIIYQTFTCLFFISYSYSDDSTITDYLAEALAGSSYVFIGLGVFISLAGFLGCVGACCKIRTLLIIVRSCSHSLVFSAELGYLSYKYVYLYLPCFSRFFSVRGNNRLGVAYTVNFHYPAINRSGKCTGVIIKLSTKSAEHEPFNFDSLFYRQCVRNSVTVSHYN